MNRGDIVFDVETKHSFDEVGGRNNFEKLGVSVVGAYVYGVAGLPADQAGLPADEAGQYYAFEEHEMPEFEKLLLSAGRVIGFNIHHFDFPVLKPYLSLNIKKLQILDLMDGITQGVGFRVSLDNLAEQTLGARKSGDGLQAIRWYKEGKIDDIKKYCLKDVELTKNLYEFGIKNGHVLFYSRDASGRVAIPVSWKLDVRNDLPAGKAGKLDYKDVQPSIF